MNEKITLQDLVELLSEKNDMTKKNADAFLRCMFDLIEEALTNEKYVKIKGLGTFKLTEVDSRESMNVNTGERIEIQGHTKISFTPDTTMKELINKPFSHFETVILNDGVELEDTPFDIEPKVEEMADEMVEKIIEEPQVEVEPVVEVKVEVAEEPVVSPVVDEPIPVEEVSESVEEEPKEVEAAVVEEPEVPEPVVIEEKPVEVEEKVEPIEEEISEEVSIPEEKVEEKPEIVVPEAPRSENKTTFKVLIGIIVVLLLIILLGVYWIFFRQEKVDTNWEYTAPVKETASVVQVEEQQAVKEDTLLVSEDTMVVQPVQEEQTMVLPEDVVYEITGTITTLTLEPGQTLVKLALKYYGSKNFWPYIVQHNPDVIKDADRVPKGATIKIPKLEPKK
jgi:nucleoid DNA-binding protein/nucleoid-associated protein YgaU